MTTTRTCVIADDHMIVRDGVRMRLAADDTIEIVAEAADGRAAIEAIRSHAPDIALLDLRMPKLDGFQVASLVRDEGLATRIVIFSGMANPELLERGFASGVHGYVGKESHRNVLLAAIDVVLDGDRFVDPTVAARMIGSTSVSLTAREREVLELMGDGLANAVIADRLGLSPETVRNHVSAVLRKLEASSRTEAVSTAFRRSLLT